MLSPNLSDIQIQIGWYTATWWMEPVAFTALMRLLARCAINQVWTYSAPSEPCIKDDDLTLHKYAGLSLRQWKECKPSVMEFFDLKDGMLWPKNDWFAIGKPGVDRPAISASTRSHVIQRDNYRCCYCGAEEGPFDLDHIVPISKGGHPTSIENLITACAPCNRSKGAKTIQEWQA